MTHLNPFTYLSRGITVFFLVCWALHRGWTTDKFMTLSFDNMRKFKLRSVVTLLLFISMIFVIMYDIICMKFKYIEGYYCEREGIADQGANASVVHVAKVTPKALYSALDNELVNSANAMWSVLCVTKTSAMFLIHAMWHNISRKVFKSSFMSSCEFKGYVSYSIGSIVLYPIFQYIFLYDSTLTTIAPQFVYSIEIMIVGCLSQYSNSRFRRFNQGGVNTTIDFYTVMNNYLSLGCLCDSVGLITINIASAAAHTLTPFELDVLSHVFNIGFVVEYAVLFCIIYPPPSTAVTTKKSSKAAGVEMQSMSEGGSISQSGLPRLAPGDPATDTRLQIAKEIK